MVVAGPRLGSDHERKTQTTFLSGANSTACTGGLVSFTCPFHSLNQLLTRVLPLGKRQANCRLVSLKSGESSGVKVATISPWCVTSRTEWRSTMRTFPFFSGVTPQGLSVGNDQ